jgi:putative membrane protein insertion efficiency factor
MVTTFLQFINTLLTHITIFLIKLYQYTLSPDKGLLSPILKNRICPHQPHCSEYAIQTLKRYGFRKGIGKATDRILHCKPRMEKIYDPAHYRIVFFSSAPIGVPFLERLANDKRFEIVGVVTQADKPVGRGLQMQENIIKTITLQQGLLSTADDLHTPTKINPDKSLEGKAFYNRLQDKKADFLVVIAYGKILPQSILDLAHF